MASIQLSQRPLLVLAAAVVLHVILISAQVTTTAGIPFIQVVTFGAFSEVQRGTMTTVDGVRGVWSGYVALRDAQAENQALKGELQRLQIRLQEERAQAQRAENFRHLLALRDRVGVDTVAAEVIAGPSSIEFRDMTIDKGGADGVQRDMAVIAPDGVVGRVSLSSPRAARVQMLIDLNAAAGAMIERTRVQGIVQGQGSALRMEFVAATADVKTGDVVITSGIDTIYPKGFVIGTVEAVERGSGTYQEITVRPSVDFSRVEEVLVVTTRPPDVDWAQIAKEAEQVAAAQRQQNQAAAAAAGNTSPRNVAPPRPRPSGEAPVGPATPTAAPPSPRNGAPPAPGPSAPPQTVPPQNASPQNASPRRQDA